MSYENENKEDEVEKEVKEEKKEDSMIDEKEKELIENLRASYETVGALYPVIETQYGIAAGATRLKAVPEWRKVRIDANNYFEHLMAMAARFLVYLNIM
jgi:hypothetical protein